MPDDFKDSATISTVKGVVAAAGGNTVLVSKSSGSCRNSANGLDADGYVFA
ncbi:hypothetical protein PENNAL_c0023G07380 [Penicillium nalgiovense]|uniref:Uncharacterized protein n=1 Tax=Penicillium nalgiovense TaxID=60175 RepID=A0A1V6YEH3_PENNA|nr:hypothetical protein PENNAL_c0023G07380 [Penicillium nalgiovense]